jgi:protease-4
MILQTYFFNRERIPYFRTLKRPIMNFWKSFFAAFLAIVLFSVCTLFLFLGIVAAVSGEEEVILADNSVLQLKLDADIIELHSEGSITDLEILGGGSPQIGLVGLKNAILYAGKDPKIKGIYLDISSPGAGFATLEEIRSALMQFRASGKWVITYANVLSEGAYYLATASDKIFLNPNGEVELDGLVIEVSFYKQLFDKLQIKPEIFRVGEFKSAVEPFLMDKMSAENREQLSHLANGIYNTMLDSISAARNIDRQLLKEWSNKKEIRTAAIAKERGLVDDVLYKDQLLEEFKNRIEVAKTSDVKFISYSKYKKTVSTYRSSKNEIAVIVADGNIMSGKSSSGVIGADTFIEDLRKARENSSVKAVVVRINSPGGELIASDNMWREIKITRDVKPVIASMGDYAASGGYYMAMACDTIVAQPNTITGSIGIFGVMFDLSSFLGNKLGITFDDVRTGEFGQQYTVTRPLTNAERNYWQRTLDESYDQFITKAAEGRGTTKDEILKVASGRVWTGTQAQEHKLVDILGDLQKAIEVASEKADVSHDYKVKYYPIQKPLIEQLLAQLEGNAQAEEAVQKQLGEFYGWYQQFNSVKTFAGSQARIPFQFTIQ